MPPSAHDTEDLAIDFLEQWLSGNSPSHAPQPPSELRQSFDPSLRAIERLVAQHKDLFRRHAENRQS